MRSIPITKPCIVYSPNERNTRDGELMPSKFLAPAMASPTTDFAAFTAAPAMLLIPFTNPRIKSAPADTIDPTKPVTVDTILLPIELTADTALLNPDFLRYAVAQIQNISDYLTDMTTSYNDGTIESFTPKADQRLRVLSLFERALVTVVQYSAFHEEMVSLNAYSTINFWQSEKTKDSLNIKRASDGEAITKANIVAVLHDRDALGIYKEDVDILTTPVNAKGMYYNTFYHQKELWFNDKSENFVFFTLN